MGLQFFFNIKKREKSQNVTNRDKKTNIFIRFFGDIIKKLIIFGIIIVLLIYFSDYIVLFIRNLVYRFM